MTARSAPPPVVERPALDGGSISPLSPSRAASSGPPGFASRLRRRVAALTPFGVASGVVAAALAALIAVPLGYMVYRAIAPEGSVDLSSYAEVTRESWFGSMLVNTVFVIGVSGFIAVVVASTFAWLNERTDARLGTLGDLLPLIPLLLPAVAMAIGWTFLASPRAGFLNTAVTAVLSPLGIEWELNIFSWYGLIFVYVLYFVPYVYILVAAALRNVDPSLEEASQVCGAGLLRTVRRVSLPSIRPAMAGGGLLVVIVGLALYSVPTIIATPSNIDILSVRTIRMLTFSFPPRTSDALVLSTIMVVLITTMWLIQRRVNASGRFATIGGRTAGVRLINLGIWRWPARLLMIGYVVCSAVLPVGALLVVALQPFWTPDIDVSQFNLDNFRRILFDQQLTRNALGNSIRLGAIGGLVAMVLAGLVALYVRSGDSFRTRGVDGITKLPAAISNVVIAVGFLLVFSQPPFSLAGTILILLLCYVVVYMPQASIAAGTAVTQIGADLFEASAVAGAGEGRTARRVALPLMLPGLAAGWSLVFVLMAGDLAASALLAGIRNPTVGFVILDIWEAGSFGVLAALSFAMVAITSTVVLVVNRLARPRYRHT